MDEGAEMPKETEVQEQGGRGRKALTAIALAGTAAGVAVLASVASSGSGAAAHDHGSGAEGMPVQLAQVRAATARFHRVEAAEAAGYERGWVNGSGVRIVAGCVSHPTAGAM